MTTWPFVMRAVGASPKEIRKRIPYVLELVGLGKKADSYPTELSGGEQQRVAIARALVNNPNTIIADEPTGNLDPERSLELMSLLVKINELGTTVVVVVTHEKRPGGPLRQAGGHHRFRPCRQRQRGRLWGGAYPWLNVTISAIFSTRD